MMCMSRVQIMHVSKFKPGTVQKNSETIIDPLGGMESTLLRWAALSKSEEVLEFRHGYDFLSRFKTHIPFKQ